jgi:uncharacterized protein YeaO (DUF488 family)
MVTIKRVYDPAGASDGVRILVDRLWPRGVKKQSAQIERWIRELGPSDELRKFFGHEPARWREFRNRYIEELKRPETQAWLAELARIARDGTLTLVYGAKDEQHNQAVVLKELVEKKVRKM